MNARHSAAATLLQLSDAITARDWTSMRAVLADEVTVRYAHTGQMLGADGFVAFNRDYPGDWRYVRDEVVDGGDRAVTRSRTIIGDQTWHVASFGSINEHGLITDLVEIWTDAVAS